VIAQETQGRDALGGETLTWSTFLTCWASKDEKTGSESHEADRITAKDKTIWVIRYNTTSKSVDEKMVIRYDSKDYDITSVKEIGRGRFLEIESEKRTTQNAITIS
jgi:SPP1 family predicted phage head-tail adaptor